MNLHLKNAVERYEKDKKTFLINPISNIDAEIIVEITELFKKAGITEAVNILKDYKLLKDEETRDNLLELNTNFNQTFKPKKTKESTDLNGEIIEEEEDDKITLLKFNDFRRTAIKTKYILGYRDINITERDTGTIYPSIIINECDETATKKPMFANTILHFTENEERDEAIDYLDENL